MMMPEKRLDRPASIPDLAARLIDLGYHPVPIESGSKGPTIAGWDKLHMRVEDVPRYFDERHTVVGCLHDNLACFDIDVYDADLAARIVEEAVRRFPTALERIGQEPKSAIVLRLEDSFKVHGTKKYERITEDGEIITAQVDVRTTSRQMVVYGKHPATQKPYRWTRGELWATPWADLPALTQDDAQSFRDWCETLLRDWAGVQDKPPATVIDIGFLSRGLSGDRPSEKQFLAALDHVSPSMGHDSGWLECLMGIHDFYGGNARGLEMAKSWSAGDSRYTPHEVEAKWKSFEVGKGVGYRTIFHHAKQSGADLSAIARMDRPEPANVDLSFDIATAPTGEAPQSVLEWFDDITPALDAPYLVKGVLDQGAMSVIYGPSNSGKTFFSIDLAFHVAIGAEWRGRRVVPAGVLYLAAEGGRAIRNRIAALRATTGACDVPLALRRAGLDLLREGADLQAIAALAAEVQARVGDAPLLIVIDTLSRVMAGGDENSAADMTALIRNIDAIREHTGAHIMLVHHTGKDTARGARGHSSLRAATDTEIEVGAPEDGGSARLALVTKQRDHAGGETFAFVLKGVSLGHDADGDEVTTCVVEEADAEEARDAAKARKGLGGNQKLIAETFDQMVSEGMARPNPGGVGFPEPGRFYCVDADELRRIAQGKMVGDNPAKLFRQAWKALTDERGLFCVGDKLAWRTDRRINK